MPSSGMHRNIIKVPKKVLVTGINGFIGSHLAPRLLEKGYSVIGVDLTCPTKKTKGIKFLQLDLAEDNSYRFLPSDIDIIIHLAVLMDKGPTGSRLFEVFKINCSATLKLLEYARKIKIKKFIFSSTANVIGYRHRSIKENDLQFPGDFYGFTKMVAEKLVNEYQLYFQTQIMRIFFPYGQSQSSEAVISRLVRNIRKRRRITLYNQGKNPVLSFIFINDLIEIICDLLNKNVRIINITSAEKYSILQICEMISKKLEIKPRYRFVKDRKCSNMTASLNKLKSLINYKCKTRLMTWIGESLS